MYVYVYTHAHTHTHTQTARVLGMGCLVVCVHLQVAPEGWAVWAGDILPSPAKQCLLIFFL